MSNPHVRISRRIGVACLWLLAGMLVSPLSYAAPQPQYGPPYSANSTSGSAAFPTVGQAVQFIHDGIMRLCESGTGGCVNPPVITDSYSDGYTVAYVYSNGREWGRVFANDNIPGQGSPAKNAGSCNTMCTGGLGQQGDNTGPHGSSGDAALKQGGVHRGSSFEGDPINTATGNMFRQDTDYDSPTWLTLRRFYNSKTFVTPVALGKQWRHSFERTLDVMLSSVANGGSRVEARRPDGGVERFRLSNGVWTTDPDMPDILTERRDSAGLLLGFALDVRATQQTEIYDTAGLLRSVFDRMGQTVLTLAYSDPPTVPGTKTPPNLLQRVTDAGGRSLSFAYDSNSRLSTVTLPDGGMLTYGYDATGNLTSVQYPDGKTRQYVYNEQTLTSKANLPTALTGVIDEKGVRFESTGYASNGKAISSSFAGNVDAMTVEYAASTYNWGIPATITSPLGTRVTLGYTDSGYGSLKPTGAGVACGEQCNQPWKSLTYDANGYPASTTDFKGTVTKTTYAAGGLLTQQIDASGTTQQRTTNTTWNTSLRVPLTRTVLDAAGATAAKTAWTYNARGQQTARCEVDPAVSAAMSYSCGSAANAPAGVRQWRTSYCDTVDGTQCPQIGLVLSQDGPRTDVADTTTYRYYLTADESGCANAGGACHRAGDLYQVVDALGRATTYVAYDRNGRPTRTQDANGLIRDLTYTPRGWAASSTLRANADGTPSDQDQTTLVAYDEVGNVSKVTDPDGTFAIYGYDAAHRLTDVTDGAGNTIHYTLDPSGNRFKEDTKDASGALKHTLSRIYNNLGQLATQATAEADPTDFSYDLNGNVQLVTDALKRKTQTDYDPLNRVKQALQDVGGIAAKTQFDYDALDRTTKVTDPKGLATSYQYNGLGDLLKLTSPDTGVTSYTYNSAGNLATQTDARATKTNYVYDALGRLAKATYADKALIATYTYDATQTVCATGETFALGRLSKLQDGSGLTQYCYDRFGRVMRKVQTTNGKALTVRYAYTKGGRLSRVTYPDGAVVDYVRNALGQATEVGVTAAGGTRQKLLGGATYYPFGPSAGWSYGNGRPLQRVLDQDYRPQAIQDSRSDGLNVGFGFDPVGNLTSLTAPGNTAPVVTLGYDNLDRLTAFKDGPTGTVIDGYSYDATGNRLSAQVNGGTQTYNYPTDSHRLASVAGAARSYDAAGNTTAIDGTAREFAYDATGRLSQAKRSGTLAMEYRYNDRGEQVRRFLGTTNTYTVYDEAGHWLGDYDTDGKALQQAIWLDDLPVGVLAGTALNYVQPDHLGAPRTVIDPVRDVAIWKWDIKGEAFGNSPPDQDADRDGAAFVFGMRFPGQRYDNATGLNQNYFRDYDTGTGRYGQSDLIGLGGGLSTYNYVEGNPISNIDPLGLLRFHPWVHQKYPATVAYLDAIKNRMTQKKYDGFARFANIGKDHLDHLLDSCGGPVVTPEYMRHDNGRYKPGSGEIFVHQSYFDRYESGDRSQELLNILNSTVEHELVHFTEYFWNNDNSRVEEGWYYENYVYGTKIPLSN
ncbi:RHS repeat protein [Xanthomonas sp. GW]|uniref:RHS repeat-associated core domain-containing protein n=1 Tax=Xanthomonas sp. GW TaxID=2724121 RepID=UPI00163A5CCC|nr:RHS repeat-associated core domain-containing protein [Xanthomonas sp. GW]QNH23137.1 RHS repeat protein [Xanthomonas sp. GW]